MCVDSDGYERPMLAVRFYSNVVCVDAYAGELTWVHWCSNLLEKYQKLHEIKNHSATHFQMHSLAIDF